MQRENIHPIEPECSLPGTALTCLNSLKHGATSRQLFVTGEQPQEFYKLLAESFESHKPDTTEDSALVTDAVLARLVSLASAARSRQTRIRNLRRGPEADSPSLNGLRELELFDCYRTQAERALNRALKNLQMRRKSVLDEEKWRTHLIVAKQKFDLDLKKFELRQEQQQAKQKAATSREDEDFDGAAFKKYTVHTGDTCFIEQYLYVVTKEDAPYALTSPPQTAPCSASSNIAPASWTNPKKSRASLTSPMASSPNPFNGSPNSPPPPIPTSLSASTCHSPNSSKSPLRRNPLSSAFFVLSVFLCLDLWLKGFAFSFASAWQKSPFLRLTLLTRDTMGP